MTASDDHQVIGKICQYKYRHSSQLSTFVMSVFSLQVSGACQRDMQSWSTGALTGTCRCRTHLAAPEATEGTPTIMFTAAVSVYTKPFVSLPRCRIVESGQRFLSSKCICSRAWTPMLPAYPGFCCPMCFMCFMCHTFTTRSRLSAGSLLCDRDKVECGRPAGAAGPFCYVKLLMSVLLP